MYSNLKEQVKIKTQKKELVNYESSLSYRLITTRFNSKTLIENEKFCKKHNLKCAYFSPIPLPERIPMRMICFMLEMNNDKNELSGLGVFRNSPIFCKYDAYSEMEYNRVSYIGCYRVTREEIILDKDYAEFWEYLELCCFKGRGHLKRGQGLTCFPLSILISCKERVNIIDMLVKIIKSKFKCHTNS